MRSIAAPAPADRIGADDLVSLLRASGEPTRFRILVLLRNGDLTVKDLTTILGQSQPRISRHLKLLVEAGLVERFPEGAWAYYRLSEAVGPRLIAGLFDTLLDRTDREITRDAERLDALRRDHAERAAVYFTRHAGDWDRIRALHVDEAEVDAAILAAAGTRRIETFLDLGTGTGHLLELLHDRYDRGLGLDLSHDMLGAARAEMAARGLTRAQLRHGDLYALNLPRDSFDLVTLHQVLHYLDEPARAIREAARVMRPGGRLVIVDFAPHDLEFLREEQAHRRLGFGHGEISRAIEAAGLEVETVRDLPAREADKLTVTLWIGRDTRLLVAGRDAAATLSA